VTAPILAGITVEKKDGAVHLTRAGEEKRDKALHGLNRALLQNAVLGVTEGFKREIDLVGIGFKAEVKGKNVVFSVGFSHQVTFPMPEGIKVDVAPDAKAKDITHIIVTGVDKQKVGQTATEIRGIRPPDPYKLKGFRFVGEVLKKKAGKATGK
jgi:large subunit ribosomal protein L6